VGHNKLDSCQFLIARQIREGCIGWEEGMETGPYLEGVTRSNPAKWWLKIFIFYTFRISKKTLPPETFLGLKISPKCDCAGAPSGELTVTGLPDSLGGKGNGEEGDDGREGMGEEGKEGNEGRNWRSEEHQN